MVRYFIARIKIEGSRGVSTTKLIRSICAFVPMR